jgi:hypothetical protein
MDAWLRQARDAVAQAGGKPPAELEIDEVTAAILLDLARIAAHESGERTNAPLLCYLIGRAEGPASVEQLAEAVRGLG